ARRTRITRLRTMSAVVTTVIAAVSAFAALGSAFLYLYFGRRSDLAAAREEALALAETRRQVIVDLVASLDALELRHRQLQTELEATKAQAREDAYQTRHFYSAAVTDLLTDLRSDLERVPPDVAGALIRIRRLLSGERPAA